MKTLADLITQIDKLILRCDKLESENKMLQNRVSMLSNAEQTISYIELERDSAKFEVQLLTAKLERLKKLEKLIKEL
ncbi:MAG: hypothetical protein FNT15_06370 [Sulfurovum sp.]|nr:MAG: hypothetical protein FNT15_06370 [Sulfurovum sp.]